ncbi:MAG TPA: PEP-CTERM sorting domain-containing protein [Bryobacteraceae bacterium]|nr:PEP-CTERM sorting domain-containing protein [Bryobacteraceae bacterium]
MGSLLCRADIVVNYGLPASCPSTCTIGSSGQPDLVNPGLPGAEEQFTLTSQAVITSITFWTYEAPGTYAIPVEWSITDPLSQTIGSGIATNPQRNTPVLVDNLAGTGFDLQVSMISFNLPSPLTITPSPAPENYELSLTFLLPRNQPDAGFYWAQGPGNHVAFELLGTDTPTDPVVPEPSFFGLVAGGLGLLTALQIRRKR